MQANQDLEIATFLMRITAIAAPEVPTAIEAPKVPMWKAISKQPPFMATPKHMVCYLGPRHAAVHRFLALGGWFH